MGNSYPRIQVPKFFISRLSSFTQSFNGRRLWPNNPPSNLMVWNAGDEDGKQSGYVVGMLWILFIFGS